MTERYQKILWWQKVRIIRNHRCMFMRCFPEIKFADIRLISLEHVAYCVVCKGFTFSHCPQMFLRWVGGAASVQLPWVCWRGAAVHGHHWLSETRVWDTRHQGHTQEGTHNAIVTHKTFVILYSQYATFTKHCNICLFS